MTASPKLKEVARIVQMTFSRDEGPGVDASSATLGAEGNALPVYDGAC